MKIKLILLCLLLLSQNSFSSDRSSTSVTVLKGDNFSVGPDKSRTELTFENAVGYKYGDSFFWFDITNPSEGSGPDRTSSMYGEWSPRFSVGKTFGLIEEDSIVKDVLFSNTMEFGNSLGGITRANLHGVGIDFNIPHFAFFQWNIYIRDTLNVPGTTTQSTFVFKMPMTLSEKWRFIWSGYMDIVHGDEGKKPSEVYIEAYTSTAHQFKVDLGNLYGHKDVIFLGLEYQAWKNKYGIVDGEEEYNLKYFLQWFL